jgi:hypothetical protein
MKLLVLWVVVLLQAEAAIQTGRIDGIVTRRGTRETVPGARILVASSSDGVSVPVTLARSDRNGRFVVPGLPEGRYRILVERAGYMRALSVATVEAATTSASIELTPTGVITGRVMDAQGNPVSRVFVRAAAGTSTYQGQTNDLGEYRIFDLPPGRYVVNAAPYQAPYIEGTTLIRPTPPSPYAPGEGRAMVPLLRMAQAGEYIDPIALSREVHVPVYYPGTTDASQATTLELTAGETLTGIDMTVVRASAPPNSSAR